MAGFRTPVDICNSALQQLRCPAIYTFADTSVEARETGANYDQLRLAELRRAVWRFSTRRVILRAIDNTSQFLVPAAWATGTTYKVGHIVSYDNQYWVAMADNTSQIPGVVPDGGNLIWESYFGPLVANVWDSASGYFSGELVYKTPGNGTYTIYHSLISDNDFDPSAVDAWAIGTVYETGQVVSYSGTNYQSLTALNFGHQPDTSATQWTATVTSPTVSNSWRALTSATLRNMNIVYPLGAGPASDNRTHNAFRLPAGFLRQAPSDPKAGINPFLGAPIGNMATDWLWEGNFIVSNDPNPKMLRFVADIQSVPEFDALFAEGLASRIATELAPRLANVDHLATIMAAARDAYQRTMAEARTINGIETGPVEAYEDEFIVCRV